jgi:hypothetical protein
MVQVDVFWSYGLASGLALAASRRIKTESHPWVNEHFMLTFAWIALFFAPSGLYLLWQFPGWETMFVAHNHRDIPAWLVTAFAVTNVTQGMLGYFVTATLLRKGKDFAAKLQPVWSHAAMLFILFVGWDGTGFTRFSYAGTGEEWARGVSFPWTAFFTAPIALTLLAMGAVLVPSYALIVRRLRRTEAYSKARVTQPIPASV